MLRRRGLLGLIVVLSCALLALGLALAWAQEKPTRPLRAQTPIPRGEALHVLGQAGRPIKDEEREALDLENCSGLKRTWECITAFIPIKADKLVFPEERAPVWLLAFQREMGDDSGIMKGLPPSLYVVVCKPGAKTAELFNFYKRQEPVATIPMETEDLTKEMEAPRWLLRQRGKELSYHLYMGEKHYSWTIIGEEEEDEE